MAIKTARPRRHRDRKVLDARPNSDVARRPSAVTPTRAQTRLSTDSKPILMVEVYQMWIPPCKATARTCYNSFREAQVMKSVIIAGGGLAGSEAAWHLAERGHPVMLYEMRPARPTPAHQTDQLAELVCSNSLKSNQRGAASWLVKEELRRGDSLLMRPKSNRMRTRSPNASCNSAASLTSVPKDCRRAATPSMWKAAR